MSIRSLMKAALRRKEFFLAYQPMLEVKGGRSVGSEALFRWRRPDGQFVRPDLFIPVAEETGLIHDITKEVMRLIAQDASRFLKTHTHLHIGINLSSRDLVMEDTPHLVRE